MGVVILTPAVRCAPLHLLLLLIIIIRLIM